MRVLSLIILLFSAFTTYGENAVEELAKQLQKDDEMERMASHIVADDHKEEMIQYLRRVRDGKVYGSPVSSRILLVNLGDEEYIDQLFANFESDDHWKYLSATRVFERTANVDLIPMLAPYIYLNEKNIMFFEGTPEMFPSRSYTGSLLALHMLSQSPDLTEEVRAWAKLLVGNGLSMAQKDYRVLMRQWWEENKAHFETKEYDRLRPLEVVSPSKTPTEGEAIIADSGSGEPVAAENSIPPMTADPSSLPESTAHPAGNRLDELWLLVAAALAVLAAAAWMVRRRW